MDLPVNINDIEDFIETWAEYDPEGDGFIPIRWLENFMKNLAKKNDKLFWSESFRKMIADENFNEDLPDFEKEKIIKNNRNTRQRYIRGLEIPMYNNLDQVFFHDVLQMMT